MQNEAYENKKVKQPKLSLKERYNDIFLEEAENRRKKLQYQRLHVGQINNSRIEHMIKLLYQVHQNYYFGYFEASCTLAGSMFEQSLMILLEEKMQEDGYISVYRFNNGKKIKEQITNVEDLAQFNIGFLISIVNNYNMLPKNEYNTAKTIQCIRNCIVHDMLPEFRINDKYYEEYLGMNKNGVLKIKNIENTDTLKLKLEFNVNDTIELNEFILKELNLVNFEKAYKQVQEKQIENIEFKNSTLKATVNIKNEKSYVFTTIPYDEGWSLEANGKKVDVENSNGFVTFALEKGKQEIKLSYMPKGLKAGMVITGISIVIFIALIQVKKYKKMRN